MSRPCPGCGCIQSDAGSLAAHEVVAALVDDDIDRAIESGLLTSLRCDACTADCRAQLLAARDQRATALAARGRYRARNARLQHRAEQRAMQRNARPTGQPLPGQAAPDQAAPNQSMANQSAARPALPTAAAAALARAKAEAARRGRQ